MTDKARHTGTALIYAINRTQDWWSHVGDNLGYERSLVVTDIRNTGDICVVEDFYRYYTSFYRNHSLDSNLLSAAQVEEVIARCRLLRFLPKRRAAAMALAMAAAFDTILETEQPSVILSFPIDRYVSDVLEIRARARSIPYFELTASAIEDMCMLLYRGRLIKRATQPERELVERCIRGIVDPLFTPKYVQGRSNFTVTRFLKVFYYFRLRAVVFKIISWCKRDPLNLHYLDAQSFLGHKPHLSDARITGMVDHQWRSRLEAMPKEKRLLIGLQLFPEASIDYWIDDLKMIEHEDLLVDVASAFSKAGFLILVKDHPLQFGFRQVELLERLLKLPNVVLVPYEVSGNELLALSGVSFTCTGTLGLQAALLGMQSIVTENYYSTPGDFTLLENRQQVSGLPARILPEVTGEALAARQISIIENLLRGSFPGDFLSFRNFDPGNPSPGIAQMARVLGDQMTELKTEVLSLSRSVPID